MHSVEYMYTIVIVYFLNHQSNTSSLIISEFLCKYSGLLILVFMHGAETKLYYF